MLTKIKYFAFALIIIILSLYLLFATWTNDRLKDHETRLRNIEDHNRPAGEYQVYLNDDSIRVYDGSRYVGAVVNGNTAIDSLFWKDNE